MKTVSTRREDAQHDWYVVDAEGKTLGRLASEIARRLRGKHKAEYTPHVDTGDYIVVVNAEKVRVTGKKEQRQDLLSTLGIPGRHQGHAARENARRAPGARPDRRDQGHDAAQSARSRHVAQAEGLCRAIAPARGATAASPRTVASSSNLGVNEAMPDTKLWHRSAQDGGGPASSSGPVRVASSSTGGPWTSSSVARPRAWSSVSLSTSRALATASTSP